MINKYQNTRKFYKKHQEKNKLIVDGLNKCIFPNDDKYHSLDALNRIIINNEFSYMLIRRYSLTYKIYHVDALFTIENKENLGYAQKLLNDLPKDKLFIIDTRTKKLKSILLKLGAKRVPYFESDYEDREQFVFTSNNNYEYIPKKCDLDSLD